MARRTTRRNAPRRGMATAFLVIIGVFVIFVGGSVAATAGGLFAAYNYFASGLSDPHLLDDIELPASTYVYDRTGKTLLARFECQNREQVSFDELPEAIVDATVAAEDRTFWTNDGVDYRAVVAAAMANLEAGEIVRGASTITAQVIKYAGSIKEAEAGEPAPDASAAPSLPLDPEEEEATEPEDVCEPPDLTFLAGRGYDDKIREFILARQMTAAYPGREGKQRILETYLNLIFYGNGSYGIKAAAANYFGIADLNELSIAQSAFLAGLPQLPSAYDPYFNDQGPRRAIARRNVVLDAMLRDGYITQRQHDKAVATTWRKMNPHRITSVLREPHFSFRVRREAAAILESMGVPNAEQAVRTGGYRITTTLDYELQEVAKEQVVKWVTNPSLADKNVNNGALVAIDSNTGEIVAYVGSVDYYNRKDPRVQGQFDVAGQGVRQPGSAFKPITYSSAFVAREATPATFFVDAVTQFGPVREDSYMPTNADITDHGPLVAADALRFSLNVPSVMMQYLVGPQATAQFAERMGVASAEYIMDQDPGLTLTLGTVPVNLTNMTGAYGVFAQKGVLHQPTTIIEIRDRDNRVIYTREDDLPRPKRPMTAAEAYLTHWILDGNTNPEVNPIWGPPSRLLDPNGQRRSAGFKTGTTDDFRDVSGFGYVPGSLVTGVWMGNNNQEPMSNVLGQGLFSADGPMYLWHDFMEIALNRPFEWNGNKPVPQTSFDRPEGVVMEEVCRWSGMSPTGACGQTREMPFLEGTVPPPDNVHPNGCFDVELAIQLDERRPDEWIESARTWANRWVNRQTGSVGDPTELKENPDYRLRIAPLNGQPSWESICGDVIFTPRPQPTDRGGPDPTRPGENTPKPKPTECPGNSCGGDDDDGNATRAGTTLGLVPPLLGASALASLAPLLARARQRRRPPPDGAWDNPDRVQRRPGADPGGG
ncbi:MAG: penicillin-binding protein [Chloroflexota bacterium]|nr:penicillin-binding protein [Chloroflexota bacterium]